MAAHPGDPDLDRLLAERGDHLLRAAIALAGNQADGEDLLQAALDGSCAIDAGCSRTLKAICAGSCTTSLLMAGGAVPPAIEGCGSSSAAEPARRTRCTARSWRMRPRQSTSGTPWCACLPTVRLLAKIVTVAEHQRSAQVRDRFIMINDLSPRL